MLRAVPLVLAAWTTTAALFGAQLYFSSNRSLANPIVNPLVPLAKDAIWIGVIMFVIAATIGRSMPAGRRFIYVSALSTVGFAAVVLVTHCTSGCNYAVASLLKNALLYSLGGMVMGYLIANLGLERQALRVTLGAITAALSSSVVLFATFEFGFKVEEFRQGIDVPILRLFGTFGNPNTAGWAAVLGIPLALLFPRLVSTQRATGVTGAVGLALLTLIFVVLFCSASLSALLGAVVTAAVFLGLEIRHVRQDLAKLMVAAATGLVVAMGVAPIATPGYSLELIDRIVHILGGGSSHSFGTRVADFKAAWQQPTDPLLFLVGGGGLFRQYDSALLTLYVNFGFLGLILFVLPYLYVIFLVRNLSTSASAERLVRQAFLPSYMSFMSVNFLLQHQLLLFPLNFFFCFLAGMTVTSAAGVYTGRLSPRV